MSTPYQESIRGRASRWWSRLVADPVAQQWNQRVTRPLNRRRGKSTLKAAFAQAQRDVKRMDPAVRAAVGRAKLSKADLVQLAQAQVESAYGGRGAGLASELAARAQGRIQATHKEPSWWNVVGRIGQWNARRRGTNALEAAFAQAKRDAKRMDPAAREEIGRTRENKYEVLQFVQGAMTGALMPPERSVIKELRRAREAAEALDGHEQPEFGEGERWPSEAENAQAEAAASGPTQEIPAQGQRGPQVGGTAAGTSPTRGEQMAAAVGFATGRAVAVTSRWLQAQRSKATELAKQIADAYRETRQNPTRPSATRQDTDRTPTSPYEIIERVKAENTAETKVPTAAEKVADAKARLAQEAHAGLNTTVPSGPPPAESAAEQTTELSDKGSFKGSLPVESAAEQTEELPAVTAEEQTTKTPPVTAAEQTTQTPPVTAAEQTAPLEAQSAEVSTEPPVLAGWVNKKQQGKQSQDPAAEVAKYTREGQGPPGTVAPRTAQPQVAGQAPDIPVQLRRNGEFPQRKAEAPQR